MSTAMPLSLEARIKAQAFGLGFDLVGITTLGRVETARAVDEWLDAGYAGSMDYLPLGRDTVLGRSLAAIRHLECAFPGCGPRIGGVSLSSVAMWASCGAVGLTCAHATISTRFPSGSRTTAS